VFNGESVTGKITLADAAPAGGLTVAIQSTNPSFYLPGITVPTTVVVPAGKKTVSFQIDSPLVYAPEAFMLKAWSGPYSATANLTVLCPNVESIGLSPDSVKGGATITATITLDHAAGSISPTVSVTSDNSAVAIQSQPYFANGTRSAKIKIATSAVKSKTVVTLTAKGGSTTKTVMLTVNPS
jgi:hypothetical protein